MNHGMRYLSRLSTHVVLMNMPIEAPMFDSTNTNSTRVARFLNQELGFMIASGMPSQSSTVGRRIQASTNAVTIPTAMTGLSVVSGAANTPDRIVRG